MGNFNIEILLAARKIRTHCTKWSNDEIIDEIIKLYNKYFLPDINILLTKLEEKEREVEVLHASNGRKITEIVELKAENERLIGEVEILRQYGNKDCTPMADEALASLKDDE